MVAGSEGLGLDMSDTFGAMYSGAFITMAIYGITTLQTYFYFLNYWADGWDIKALVSLIWAVDTLHVIFMCHSLHVYLIDGVRDPTLLREGTWSLFASIGCNVFIAFLVQSFFTKRIHDLNKWKWKWTTSIAIALIVSAHFVFGMETVIQFSLQKAFAKLGGRETYHYVVPFGVTAVLSDIVIALALCILLHNTRSEFEGTNSVINTLIVYAINRCVLTSAVAVGEVIVFIVLPETFYSFAIDFVIGKLYANSLLASLNSRRSLLDRSKKDSGQASTDASTAFNIASEARVDLAQVNLPLESMDRESVRGPSDEYVDDGSAKNRRRLAVSV